MNISGNMNMTSSLDLAIGGNININGSLSIAPGAKLSITVPGAVPSVVVVASYSNVAGAFGEVVVISSDPCQTVKSPPSLSYGGTALTATISLQQVCSLTTGAIIGIAVGAAIIGVGIIIVGVVLYKRLRSVGDERANREIALKTVGKS